MAVDRVEFHGKVVLEISDIDGEWILNREFQAKVFMTDGTAEWIFIPEGFRTDLASVPRWPGMFMLFGGKARKSAVLHDFLYRETKRDREWCDAVFYAAMRAEEPGWRRAIMWLGVRIGGAFARDERPAPTWPDA
jgi:hypothetical protein